VKFADNGATMRLGLSEPVSVRGLEASGLPPVMMTIVIMADEINIDLAAFGNSTKRVTVHDYRGALVQQTVTQNKSVPVVGGNTGSVYIVRVEILK
jgi:hypothetical protein